MYKEPKPMQEIHKIQEQLYEETRGLSGKEIIEKYRREAEEVIKKYGLKFKKRKVRFA